MMWISMSACKTGGGNDQRITLRTSLPGLPPLIAFAENPDVNRALGEAKRELIRQLEHKKSARETREQSPTHACHDSAPRRLRAATDQHPRTQLAFAVAGR